MFKKVLRYMVIKKTRVKIKRWKMMENDGKWSKSIEFQGLLRRFGLFVFLVIYLALNTLNGMKISWGKRYKEKPKRGAHKAALESCIRGTPTHHNPLWFPYRSEMNLLIHLPVFEVSMIWERIWEWQKTDEDLCGWIQDNMRMWGVVEIMQR